MKKLTPFAALAVAALALAGCSGTGDETTDLGDAPQGTSDTTETAMPNQNDSDESTDAVDTEYDERDVRAQHLDIDHEQAVDIALTEAGGGFVFALELDHSRHHGEWVYEVEVQDGSTQHEIDISAMTGDVVEHDTDSDDDREREITFDMTPDEALSLADQFKPDTVLEGWTLSWDDGQLEYEIDVEPGDDLIVDVATGDVRED
ncbi:MAG TPA: PepSY domain-containing protein [Candidatus Agrococcus pullicola]|uniref:PepSY domain-containing protein n=1 Tax=Candidatus Agrococcus pullicola TaxID=2838429 RepID=A0A9D1YSF6_9MICO|nr:PepSY domain-containing protein [Candidatus Agrococcus pullicola]